MQGIMDPKTKAVALLAVLAATTLNLASVAHAAEALQPPYSWRGINGHDYLWCIGDPNQRYIAPEEVLNTLKP
jgi:hypothetical protein